MARARTICRRNGCGKPATRGKFCDGDAAVYERERGTTQERGYGARHEALRVKWAPIVERGEGVCWRCERAIDPAGGWHLGHDDDDRSIYRGPEHVDCNLGKGQGGTRWRRAT